MGAIMHLPGPWEVWKETQAAPTVSPERMKKTRDQTAHSLACSAVIEILMFRLGQRAMLGDGQSQSSGGFSGCRCGDHPRQRREGAGYPDLGQSQGHLHSVLDVVGLVC